VISLFNNNKTSLDDVWLNSLPVDELSRVPWVGGAVLDASQACSTKASATTAKNSNPLRMAAANLH